MGSAQARRSRARSLPVRRIARRTPTRLSIAMSNESDDVKRWTARRKATAVMDILKGKTTASELARSHDLTVAEVEQWLEDFVSMGTEALRSHPRDAEARHKAEKKELLAKIGELTMEKEVWMIARDILGKPLPDANS